MRIETVECLNILSNLNYIRKATSVLLRFAWITYNRPFYNLNEYNWHDSVHRKGIVCLKTLIRRITGCYSEISVHRFCQEHTSKLKVKKTWLTRTEHCSFGSWNRTEKALLKVLRPISIKLQFSQSESSRRQKQR
jgi:hypothetical protein